MKLLPTPKDLGHPSDALPSRYLSPETERYTWEDWRAEVRAKHPIRWQLQKVVDWLASWPKLSHAWYWFRTHTYNKYHLLDIRRAEPENVEGYRWGWCDRDHLLLLSSFLILRDFVEKEKPQRPDVSECDESEKEAIIDQQSAHDEIMALYNWWVKDRFAEHAAFEKAIDEAHERWRANSSDRELAQKMFDADDAERKRDDEMLLRLLKIRHHLWT